MLSPNLPPKEDNDDDIKPAADIIEHALNTMQDATTSSQPHASGPPPDRCKEEEEGDETNGASLEAEQQNEKIHMALARLKEAMAQHAQVEQDIKETEVSSAISKLAWRPHLDCLRSQERSMKEQQGIE